MVDSTTASLISSLKQYRIEVAQDKSFCFDLTSTVLLVKAIQDVQLKYSLSMFAEF